MRRHVGPQRRLVEEVALLAAPAGVADHAGGAAGEGDRPVAGVGEAAQHEQADEVADVQAVGGRVAPVVERDRALGEPGGQRLPVGGVVDQATGVEVGEEVERFHGRRAHPRVAEPWFHGGVSELARGPPWRWPAARSSASCSYELLELAARAARPTPSRR